MRDTVPNVQAATPIADLTRGGGHCALQGYCVAAALSRDFNPGLARRPTRPGAPWAIQPPATAHAYALTSTRLCRHIRQHFCYTPRHDGSIGHETLLI